MKPFRIRWLLIALLLLVQGLIIAGSTLGNQRLISQNLIEQSSLRLQRLGDSYVVHAEHFLEPIEAALHLTQAQIARRALNGPNQQILARHLLEQQQLVPSIRGMIVAHTDGRYVSSERTKAAMIVRLKSNDQRSGIVQTRYPQRADLWRHWPGRESTYDPRSRPWYQQAVRADSSIWSAPYRFYGSDDPGITLATRAGDQGEYVVAIHVDIAALSEYLAVLPEAQGGSAAILDAQQRAIAVVQTTRSETLPASVSSPAPALGADPLPSLASAGEPLDALLSLVSQPKGTPSYDNESLVRFELHRQTHLGMVRRVQLAGGRTHWTLLAQAPAQVYAGGVQALFNQQLLILVSLVVLSSLLAVPVILRLTAEVYHLHRSATRDGLTGALTRAELQRRAIGMTRQRRRQEPEGQITCVVLDLDGFKAINDRYGHAAGDAVLAAIVARLRGRLRRQDLVGRLGGDEFALVLRCEDSIDTHVMIEAIRSSVVARPIDTEGGTLWVGMTAGFARWQPGESIQQTMARADQALIAGKARDKNCTYPCLVSQAPQAAIGTARNVPTTSPRWRACAALKSKKHTLVEEA